MHIRTAKKQDYNIILNNDIHIVIELSVICISHIWIFQLSEQKYFLLHKGVRICEDALYYIYAWSRNMGANILLC